MKNINYFAAILFFCSVTLQGAPAFAIQDIRTFLKTCAIGTGAGALIGTMSLVLTDKPSENLNNIAKGTSLGLYGGIIYGLSDVGESSSGVLPTVATPASREEATNSENHDFSSLVFLPRFDLRNHFGGELLFTMSF